MDKTGKAKDVDNCLSILVARLIILCSSRLIVQGTTFAGIALEKIADGSAPASEVIQNTAATDRAIPQNGEPVFVAVVPSVSYALFTLRENLQYPAILQTRSFSIPITAKSPDNNSKGMRPNAIANFCRCPCRRDFATLAPVFVRARTFFSPFGPLRAALVRASAPSSAFESLRMAFTPSAPCVRTRIAVGSAARFVIFETAVRESTSSTCFRIAAVRAEPAVSKSLFMPTKVSSMPFVSDFVFTDLRHPSTRTPQNLFERCPVLRNVLSSEQAESAETSAASPGSGIYETTDVNMPTAAKPATTGSVSFPDTLL